MPEILKADDYSAQALAELNRENANLQRLEMLKDTTLGVASAASDVARAAANIAECVRECVRIRCEYEYAMREMQESYAHRKEKLDRFAPMLRSQIERSSDRLDRVLDQALGIDTATATLQQLNHRAQLLQTVDSLSMALTKTLTQLMAM